MPWQHWFSYVSCYKWAVSMFLSPLQEKVILNITPLTPALPSSSLPLESAWPTSPLWCPWLVSSNFFYHWTWLQVALTHFNSTCQQECIQYLLHCCKTHHNFCDQYAECRRWILLRNVSSAVSRAENYSQAKWETNQSNNSIYEQWCKSHLIYQCYEDSHSCKHVQ